MTPVSGRIRPITDEQLLKSLQYVLGKPDASFREGQLEACRHVANSKTENAMVGLDCGVGKSTTFTVPLYAKWRYQQINGVTMVICPHSIALKQHYATFFLLGSHQLQQDGKFAPVGLILIPSLKRRYIHPSLHGRSPPFWLRLRGPYLLENTVERSQHSTFLHSTLVQKLRFILVVYRPFCKYSHHGEAIVDQDHHMGRSGPRI